MLEKVISGGQTGVDRAALDAAIELGIPHGGWCPKGRTARDGVIPSRYKLQETTSPLYPPRTRANVKEADGTLIYMDPDGEYSRGSELTIKICKEYEWATPYLVIRHNMSLPFTTAHDWILAKNIHVLNVAGPSEENHVGIYRQSYLFFLELFRKTRRSL